MKITLNIFKLPCDVVFTISLCPELIFELKITNVNKIDLAILMFVLFFIAIVAFLMPNKYHESVFFCYDYC